MILRYTGKAPKPRTWIGPFTKSPYAFGGHLQQMPVDARDARAFESGPFEVMHPDIEPREQRVTIEAPSPALLFKRAILEVTGD